MKILTCYAVPLKLIQYCKKKKKAMKNSTHIFLSLWEGRRLTSFFEHQLANRDCLITWTNLSTSVSSTFPLVHPRILKLSCSLFQQS